jgi:hypothetical protein
VVPYVIVSTPVAEIVTPVTIRESDATAEYAKDPDGTTVADEIVSRFENAFPAVTLDTGMSGNVVAPNGGTV